MPLEFYYYRCWPVTLFERRKAESGSVGTAPLSWYPYNDKVLSVLTAQPL
ncbi:hypothetical protein NEUTE1DRAFT_50284 [Neurospora tetrasperma FGSC 2508]|uniref:Uncharacterized protein n=1 Tax=Neurospora tetrasperma (strain FGSC 2508 / ATCC MYA-4615 / P0657) TaxID=510951 RepID=F8MVP9_NEUT8|nr:uncharacterized protein NEUTE1DRAFT_50284 [Neurospora tetrasperma FGSC 2508]EGO54800.1 hypothetical protein NEUTE1DRAFT_50284 [Neurospora tetrasperma FGSC 2508]EGZ67715.1 hypothetical protein NEUTE2DRAFT_132393 [Neurospora tetrasperma FGSC 2509]